MNAVAAPKGWLLAIDASTPRCVIAVGRTDTPRPELIVGDDEDDDPRQASVRLQARIEAVLRRAEITAGQLVAVACGRGPGTFTGTRVAVATAKGLAYGLGVPTVPMSTLAIIAASAEHHGLVLATVDARRKEVYAGLWRCQVSEDPRLVALEGLSDERVAPLSEVLAAMENHEGLVVAGSGVEPYREALTAAGLEASAQPLPGPTAAGLWSAAVDACTSNGACHPAALDALYLRASYAEMGVSTPKRPFVKSPFV